MALIDCPDCGRKVSDRARSCPNCGRPTSAETASAPAVGQTQRAPRKTSCVTWGCLGLIILVIVVAIASSRSEVGSRSDSPAGPGMALPARPTVSNSSLATSSDVRQAEEFLAALPPACGQTTASAGSDGTITIELKCSGSSQSLNGLVRIKDGVVTDIR
ncbi:MAG: zinc ribbon domain-containing protein [Acidobacteriota bacterium]|nr:zinc ribbon domain-containing protein [Acidobacteriota bacterium]